jgi:hypothetical protein
MSKSRQHFRAPLNPLRGIPALLNGHQPQPAEAVVLRPSQDDMGEEKVRQYLNSIDRLLQTVLPRDSQYVLVLASPKGKVNWVTTLAEKSAANLLGQLARHIDPPAPTPAEAQTPSED